MRSAGLLIPTAWTLALLGGCASHGVYNLEFRNEGDVELHNVTLRAGGNSSGAGILSPRSTAIDGTEKMAPAPRGATLEWRTPDGKLHRKDLVTPPEATDKNFRGWLVYILSANEQAVRVTTEPPNEASTEHIPHGRGSGG